MSKENPRMRAVELDKNDQPIPGTEKIIWYSRSMAVCLMIYARDTKEFVLERRGPGCPDNIGKLVFCCGYLSWNESIREAACREAYEEIGLKIKPEQLHFCGINDGRSENRQNVTFRYIAIVNSEDIINGLNDGTINTDTLSRGGEADEVDEILMLPLDYLLENSEQIAFGHEEVAQNAIKNLDKILKDEYYWDSMA